MTNSDFQIPALLVSSRRSEWPTVYDISTDENRRKAFTSAVLEFFGPDGFDCFPGDDSHLEEAWDADQREELEFITPHFRRLQEAARNKTAWTLDSPKSSDVCLAEWLLGSQESFDSDFQVTLHVTKMIVAPTV